MSYNKFEIHAGIFYITTLTQITTHDKVLVYGIIEDAYSAELYRYDTITSMLKRKYSDYTCMYLQLTYIPIHYYSKSCIPSILNIVKQLCVHNGLTHIHDCMFEADNEQLCMLIMQYTMKIFGLNDLRTHAQIMKYIIGKHNVDNSFTCKIDPQVFNNDMHEYETFASKHIDDTEYILLVMTEMQKYLQYTASNYVMGFNPYTNVKHDDENIYYTDSYKYYSLITDLTSEIKALLGKY